MKKEMILGFALLLSGVACAETEEFDFDAVNANEVESITYTLKISKDEAYDKEAWADLVALGAHAAKRGMASEKGEVSMDEVVQTTLKAVEKSYECTHKEGINGNWGIWFETEQDEDATKGCDGICGGDDDRPTDR